MRRIFALVRILGNEIPPRDLPGGRLAALEELTREPVLPGAAKVWVINRVWDRYLADSYRRLLNGPTWNSHIHEIPFEPDRYFEADEQDNRLLYCPGVNHARNETLRIAFEHYGVQFAAIFDGDCGFTGGQWEEVLTEIASDYIDGVGKPVYSVSSLRINRDVWNAGLVNQPIVGRAQEPMLIIGRRIWDQGLRFDESLRFGDGDKVELLVRLGHDSEIGRQHEVICDDQCRSVGTCCHINTGDPEIEADVDRRAEARGEAMARMHEDITCRYGASS